MQDDLISRSALIEEIHKFVGADLSTEDIIFLEKVIQEQPTAYDVEKVVAELEGELKLAEKQKEECVFKALPYYDRTEGYIVATNNAIEVIRNGGKERIWQNRVLKHIL